MDFLLKFLFLLLLFTSRQTKVISDSFYVIFSSHVPKKFLGYRDCVCVEGILYQQFNEPMVGQLVWNPYIQFGATLYQRLEEKIWQIEFSRCG